MIETGEMKLNDYLIRHHERKADGWTVTIFDYSKSVNLSKSNKLYEMS
jgi:hypothetical protein